MEKLLLTTNGATMVLQESDPSSLFHQIQWMRKKAHSSLHWECLGTALLGLSWVLAQGQTVARWGCQEIWSF